MATPNLKKAAEQEARELVKGFDDAQAERTRPTAKIDIEGREFEIRRTPPAWLQLFIARYGRGAQKDVPPEKYLDFLVKVLGDEIIDHLIELGDNDFDASDLEERVIGKILAVWIPEEKPKKK